MTQPRYEYIPLTEEQIYRDSGMGDLWDQAEAGEPLPHLLRERIRAAERAMEPTISAMRAEAERGWMEGTSGCADGLSLLVGEGKKK